MPRRWNGTIATQTVPFRGTSSITVPVTVNQINFRALTRAVYALNVTGGVSGSFGVHIVSRVGGYTFTVAGLTAISAVGNYILYPAGYSATGALMPIGGAVGFPLSDVNRIDWSLPPVNVNFQSGVATAGISANCTVAATLYDGGF